MISLEILDKKIKAYITLNNVLYYIICALSNFIFFILIYAIVMLCKRLYTQSRAEQDKIGVRIQF